MSRVEYLSCTLQELGEELAKLQAEQRDQDATKRQLEECIAYQRSLGRRRSCARSSRRCSPRSMHGSQLLQYRQSSMGICPRGDPCSWRHMEVL